MQIHIMAGANKIGKVIHVKNENHSISIEQENKLKTAMKIGILKQLHKDIRVSHIHQWYDKIREKRKRENKMTKRKCTRELS